MVAEALRGTWSTYHQLVIFVCLLFFILEYQHSWTIQAASQKHLATKAARSQPKFVVVCYAPSSCLEFWCHGWAIENQLIVRDPLLVRPPLSSAFFVPENQSHVNASHSSTAMSKVSKGGLMTSRILWKHSYNKINQATRTVMVHQIPLFRAQRSTKHGILYHGHHTVLVVA